MHIPGRPMIVMQSDDMSGSISEEDFLTFNFEKLAALGDCDFIFHKPSPVVVGPMLPTVLFTDKLDGADLRRGVSDVSGFECGQFYFDEAHHYAESYKMSHTESYDIWPTVSNHYKGETPRGTKPLKVGGIKKSKQQRAAIKARRKQR